MQTQRHIQVTARREDRGPIRIVEVFQPEDMRGAVPSQRFVAALHRAMNLACASKFICERDISSSGFRTSFVSGTESRAPRKRCISLITARRALSGA